MKKYVALSLVLVCAFFAFSCANSDNTSPTSPQPTATPALLAANLLLSGFEDQTTLFTAGSTAGYWEAGNDSSAGGESTVNSFAPSSTTASAGTYSLGMNVTIKSKLPYPGTTGGYTSQLFAPAYTNAGYVTASMIFNDAVSLTNNASFSWDAYFSSPGGVNYKVFIYNSAGQYVYTNTQGTSASWQMGYQCTGDYTVPAGYTVTDVLKSVKKIVWVFRYLTTATTGVKTFDIYLDNVKIESTCTL